MTTPVPEPTLGEEESVRRLAQGRFGNRCGHRKSVVKSSKFKVQSSKLRALPDPILNFELFIFNYFPAIFLAASSASSMEPTYMNAPSGRWSHLPSQISWKLRMVSASLVKFPDFPVNGSAT